MDHQDWPEWPADDPDLGNADTADLHGGGEDLGGGLDHGGFDHDLGGPEHDLYGGDDAYGGHDPVHGFDDGVAPAADEPHHLQGQAGHDVYPDDDLFDLTGHDIAGHELAGHELAGHELAGHELAGHDDPTDVSDVVHHDDGAPFDHTDPPVGADPDVDPRADDDWHDPTFPPTLDLAEAPEPVDGYPWSDADLLGHGFDGDPGGPYEAGHYEAAWHQPEIGDLYAYAGEEQASGVDGWQALLGSDDPATSSLARWWAPGS
jgi:hypothetical protein